MQDDPELEVQMPSFPGHLMREAREGLGFTQKETARDLHLTSKVINAIEESNFELLPGSVFARGYIRSYARHIGLDGPALVAEFDAVYGNPNFGSKPMSNIPQVGEQSKPGDTWVKLFSVVLVIALLAVSLIWWQSQNSGVLLQQLTSPTAQTSSNDAPVNIDASENNTDSSHEDANLNASEDKLVLVPQTNTPGGADTKTPEVENKADAPKVEVAKVTQAAEVVEAAKIETQPTAGVESVEGAVPALLPQVPAATEVVKAVELLVLAPDQARLVMVFEKDCWVEIKDGKGKMILSDLYSAGSSIEQVVTAPIEILLGRSSGVTTMTFDGQTIDLKPHTRKDIARLTLSK